MKYYSHYIWESGSEEKENPVSVVLQQVRMKNHRCLFICVCDGTRSERYGSLVSGYFTERLVEWFHQHYLGRLCRKDKEEDVLQALSKELKRIGEELKEYGRQKRIDAAYDIWGILMYDNLFWSFAQGECKGYLFNRRFNKKQRTSLERTIFQESGRQMKLAHGRLQKDIGILICNPVFDANLSEEEMLEVLFEERLADRDIQKRLREIWRENVRRGGKAYAGAVFFRTE